MKLTQPTLAIYEENNDLFIVRATDISDDEMERYELYVVQVIRNDCTHHIQYKNGDTFNVGISKVVPGAKAYQDWSLLLPKGAKP